MAAAEPDIVPMDEGAFKDIEGRWAHINKVLDRGGPLAGPDFNPDTPTNPELKNLLKTYHFLK